MAEQTDNPEKQGSETVSQDASGSAPAVPAGNPTPDPAKAAQEAAAAQEKADLARIKELAAKASANPALVEFPTDPWGFCNDLRKVGLKAASAVSGQKDKNMILLGTLMVLIGHVRNRLEPDRSAADREMKYVETCMANAEKYARQHGQVANPEDAVRAAVRLVEQARASGAYPEITG